MSQPNSPEPLSICCHAPFRVVAGGMYPLVTVVSFVLVCDCTRQYEVGLSEPIDVARLAVILARKGIKLYGDTLNEAFTLLRQEAWPYGR